MTTIYGTRSRQSSTPYSPDSRSSLSSDMSDTSIQQCQCGRNCLAGRRLCDRCQSLHQQRLSPNRLSSPPSTSAAMERRDSPTRPSRSLELPLRPSSRGLAAQTFTHALSSEGTSSLFSNLPQRTPTPRSGSNAPTMSRSQSPRETRSPTSSLSVSRGSTDRSYSPMAAGFARLGAGVGGTEKARVTRSSLDDARLFDGPA